MQTVLVMQRDADYIDYEKVCVPLRILHRLCPVRYPLTLYITGASDTTYPASEP
mgnify:FL=1